MRGGRGFATGAGVASTSLALARLRFHARMAAPCETDHCWEVCPHEQTTRQTSCRRPGGNMDSRKTLVPPQTKQGRIVCGSSSFMPGSIAALERAHKKYVTAVRQKPLTGACLPKEALIKEPPGNALVFPLARRDLFSSRSGLFRPRLFQKK